MEIGDLRLDSESASWWERLTIADGLFVLVLVLGTVIRFVNLGQIPLAEREAELALAVWQFWQPGQDALAISSPAYFTFTSLLTQIFGFGDGVMRLVPAVFGLGMVCLPWLIRHRIGNIGALVACSFLAISPLNVAISRTVGGDAIALFAMLLLFVAMMRYQEQGNSRWLSVAFAALGLGLASAPLFYSGLVTLAVAWFAASRMGVELGAFTPESSGWRTAVLVGIAVFAACSSFFLWYPVGFGAAVQMLGTWLGQFGGGNGRTLADPFLALGRYEPGLVILGTAAILWAIWRGRGQWGHYWNLVFVYWLLAGLLLMLVQVGVMSNALVITLPGYLLIGLMAEAALRERAVTPLSWGVAALIFLLFMLIMVNVGRFLRVIVFNPQEVQYLFVIVLGFVLVAALLFLALAMDVTAVMQGILLACLAFFAFVAWGTGWWLAHSAANDPRERWVMDGTDSDVRLLLESLHTFSRQFSNSNNELEIATNVDTAVMRWYLRAFGNAEIGQTLPVTGDHPVLITPAATELQLGNAYTGADYGLSLHKSPPTAATTPLNSAVETLRWWFFHDSTQPVENERVILWVRADLAGP